MQGVFVLESLFSLNLVCKPSKAPTLCNVLGKHEEFLSSGLTSGTPPSLLRKDPFSALVVA